MRFGSSLTRGLVLSAFALCPVAAANKQVSATVQAVTLPRALQPSDESAAHWFEAGAAVAHNQGSGQASARNVILFIGDGMSLPTVAAARIFEAQQQGRSGEENQLSFETLPYTALSKTYETDSQTPDSAGTVTAMMSGVKTRMGVLGIGQQVKRGNCSRSRAAELVSAMELAETAGLSTGVVTTTRLTHATPAGAYAHTSERDWESDADLSTEARQAGCHDIARQLIEFAPGNGIDVALGGGRENFQRIDQRDPEYPGLSGRRRDGRDLVDEWRRQSSDAAYVWNSAMLAALDLRKTGRLLGLFDPDHMKYEVERGHDRGGEPSLSEMTRAAITLLKRNPKGFFLTVEGGRIDHAHHAGNAYRALSETVELSNAVRVAKQLTSERDTLIIVTADHSHTLSFVGYPKRGNPILGKVIGSTSEGSGSGLAHDALGLPYTTLSYATGPGYSGASKSQAMGSKRFPHRSTGTRAATGRPDLQQVDTEDPDFLQEALVPTASETHGGDDVGVWASGPGSAAVHGSIEQNVIFHWMVQSQPDIVRLLCRTGSCVRGVPLRLPVPSSTRRRRSVHAR